MSVLEKVLAQDREMAPLQE